jgi:Rod binding domain-containing protein
MPAILRSPAPDLSTWATRQPQSAPSATAGRSESPANKRAVDKAKDVAQQFEALYLKQMLDASLPKDSESLFGEGTSGTMWRSMFADTLATTISKTGTIGIADMIYKSELTRTKDK